MVNIPEKIEVTHAYEQLPWKKRLSGHFADGFAWGVGFFTAIAAFVLVSRYLNG